MRQIYSSPRHANIDRVVALFAQAGIETQVTDLPAHRRNTYQRFSYTSDTKVDAWPKVWIVHASDQVRAREILRATGIEPAVRYGEDLANARRASATPAAKRRRMAHGARLILLAVIAVLALVLAWHRIAG